MFYMYLYACSYDKLFKSQDYLSPLLVKHIHENQFSYSFVKYINIFAKFVCFELFLIQRATANSLITWCLIANYLVEIYCNTGFTSAHMHRVILFAGVS